MSITIKTSPAEVLLAKFSTTIATLQGYVAEAQGDTKVGTGYRPQAVLNRLLDVQHALKRDLAQLAADIQVDEAPTPKTDRP
jgi:hypothetical protein